MKPYVGGRPTPADKLAILERRKRVANAYLRGMTQWEISQQEGVSRPTIKNDLNAIRSEWLEAAAEDYGTRRAKELARIDALEAVAWDGWQRSEKGASDTRFLDRIAWCVSERCKILGLYAPQKHQHGGDESLPPIQHEHGHYAIPVEQFRQLSLPEKLRLHRQALGLPEMN
jgi:hypothetical protein